MRRDALSNFCLSETTRKNSKTLIRRPIITSLELKNIQNCKHEKL